MNGKGPKSRIKHVERYIKKTSRWKFGLPIIIVTKKMKIDGEIVSSVKWIITLLFEFLKLLRKSKYSFSCTVHFCKHALRF